ncbi:MAG: type II toxin-antitoxin system HicB family antitoxin [Candidatus Magasanikbacteria bacterium]|nr:type II toxin-antitoxin system HicB family antitoxin [Candidatus Magasanikbacteria bacterium]
MKITKVQNYKVIIERGEDGYFVAQVPALPGCVTQAKTYEKLRERTREAIELCLEVTERVKRLRQMEAQT